MGEDLDPDRGEERSGDGTDGDASRRFTCTGSLEHVAQIVAVVLQPAGEIGVSGTGTGERIGR